MSTSALKQLWKELGPKEAGIEAEFRAWRQRNWRSTLILHKFTDAALCGINSPLQGLVWYRKMPFWGFLFKIFLWNFTTFFHIVTLIAVRNNASVVIQKKWQFMSQISLFLAIIVFHWMVVEYKAHAAVMELSLQLICMGLNVLIGQFEAVAGSVLLLCEFLFYIWIRKVIEMEDNKSIGFLFFWLVFLPGVLSFIQEAYQRRKFMEIYYMHVIVPREQLWKLMPFGESIRNITQLPQKGKDFQYILMLGGLLLYACLNEWERIQHFQIKSPGFITFLLVICIFMFFELVLNVAKAPSQQCVCKNYESKIKTVGQTSYYSNGSSGSSESLDVNELLRCKLQQSQNYSFSKQIQGCCSNANQRSGSFTSENSSYHNKNEKLELNQGIDPNQTSNTFKFCLSEDGFDGWDDCLKPSENNCLSDSRKEICKAIESEIQHEVVDVQQKPQMTYEDFQRNTRQMVSSLQYLSNKMNSIGLNLHVMQSNNYFQHSLCSEESEEEEGEFNFSQQGQQEQ